MVTQIVGFPINVAGVRLASRVYITQLLTTPSLSCRRHRRVQRAGIAKDLHSSTK
ncbi:hypothetical protein ACP4OV_016169 [Aristida adscensionis]